MISEFHSYLTISKDGVVDHDSMNTSILVGLDDLVLEIVSRALSELKLDAGLSASLRSPLGILGCSRVLVGKEADQLGADVESLDRVLQLFSIIPQGKCKGYLGENDRTSDLWWQRV